MKRPDTAATTTASLPGIVVVSRDRTILFKNQTAQSMLGSDHSLVERHDRLASRNPALHLRLCAAVDEDGLTPAPSISLVPRCSGMPWLALIAPLRGSGLEGLGALLLLWDLQATRLIPATALVQMFGLTQAEASTALATYEGRTPAEIAEGRCRSIATIRAQLSRVFMKCGVRRQAELVRMLAGVTNMCCMAEGVQAGIDIGRSAHHALFQLAMQRQTRDTISRHAALVPGAETVTRVRHFAPGESTSLHYHPHGHEVLCVLGGRLTTEIDISDTWVTGAGDVRYIGPNVLHRGENREPQATVSVLSIDIGQSGQPFRVDADKHRR